MVAAITSVLSALVVWGFASGKFVQKKTDDIDDIVARNRVITDRLTDAERSIHENREARFKLVEDINRDLGRLGHKFELLEQRIALTAHHGDERNERIDDRFNKIEAQLDDMLRRVVDLTRRRQ